MHRSFAFLLQWRRHASPVVNSCIIWFPRKLRDTNLKFGIFSVVDHYPKELKRDVATFYEELLEQVEAAETLGFDSFWIAEHHFHEYGAIPRPAVWMAAAAQRTKRIRLGCAVVVLPFDNPLRVAEDLAMVDILSNGRLEVGVGSGYLTHEFAGFNLNPEEKRERFDESLAILTKAWSGAKFSYEGRFYNCKDVQLNVVPVQKQPRMHVAVLRNEVAPFVGAQKLPMMMIPYATTEKLDELAETTSNYRKALADAGGDAKNAEISFGLHTHCAATIGKARSECSEAMDRYVRTRLYARQRPIDDLIEKDLVAFGDADEVLRVAQQYQKAGMTNFLAINNFGGLPHKKVLQSMELIAKGVLQPCLSMK